MTATRSRYPLDGQSAAPGKSVRIRVRTGKTGDSVTYLGRILLPLPQTLQRQSVYVVQAGDRLDNVAAKLLGDPQLYWMLLEANGVSNPATLCAVPGRKVIVPAAIGQHAAAIDQPLAAPRSAAAAQTSTSDDGSEQS